MSNPGGAACGNCLFSIKDKSAPLTDVVCVFNPPTLAFVHTPLYQMSTHGEWSQSRPTMKHDDWCGQWVWRDDTHHPRAQGFVK